MAVSKDKPAKTTFKQWLQAVINKVDTNVLPFVALLLLAGLAVRGSVGILPILSENARLIASIGLVAALLIKLKADR